MQQKFTITLQDFSDVFQLISYTEKFHPSEKIRKSAKRVMQEMLREVNKQDSLF